MAGGGGAGGGWQGARWDRDIGSQEGQMAGDGRVQEARWQLLGVVGAGGSDGRGVVGCRRARWQLLGVVGAGGVWQKFKMGVARGQNGVRGR